MKRLGILLHVYHLQSRDWEWLVWGDPAHNKLGVGTKLFELLLDQPDDVAVGCITFSGPSSKDGLSEGAYTKRFLQDHVDRLADFPCFRDRIKDLAPEAYALFKKRVDDIVLGDPITNTAAEIELGAAYFQSVRADTIVHIAAASHAPRCIQLQAVVRERGKIPAQQRWFTVASDTAFVGTSAADVVVVEPPHRGDDPLLDFKPMLATVLRPYYAELSGEDQKRFIRMARSAMDELVHQPASQS